MSARFSLEAVPAPPGFHVKTGAAVEEPATAWLDGAIRHFSASSVRMLRICPEQYRQRYILGKKERPGAALVVGSATHDALAFNGEQKITTHEDLPSTEVVEYFHDAAWPKAVEDDGGEENIRWDEDKKPDDVRRDGERMTQAYHHSVAPRIQPVAVEKKFSIEVEGVPVPLIGYLDFEEAQDVIDVKTGKQVQRKPDANWRFQGGLYALATGKAVHFHSVSRAKTPSIATPLTDPEMLIPARPEEAATLAVILRDFAGQLEYYMTRYGPDDPWPTTGVVQDYKGGPACRFCGYRNDCVAWAWERQPVLLEVHP